MTITGPDGRAGAPDQAVVDAAMLVLDRMGLTPADLLSAPAARPAAPTFAEYVSVVSALVTDGCRRAYGSYWNRSPSSGAAGASTSPRRARSGSSSSTSGPTWCPGATPAAGAAPPSTSSQRCAACTSTPRTTGCEVPRGFRTVHPLGWMSGKVKELPRPKKSFSPEFKDEAVKMVIETSRPIARVAKELGINEGTLGNWVGIYRREHAGEEPALTVNERARLRELERETRELKMENDFLKKAAAYFAKDHR